MAEELERLTQNEDGDIFRENGIRVNLFRADLIPSGKLRTIVLKNPVDIKKEIEKYVENYPSSVPEDANSYVASDFNGSTQHIRKDETGKESLYSVFAIQFYHIN